ncbi:myc-associated zinc finger protein-like [Oryzias melastigma]|uniref:myc-associated zinc finger protein-like n=1 Tax=Oryzias melastigma TaxID=30732 RepID=UPI000CF7F5E7|nr:myc-associated zinc finger protein-like [Oryzias melastigma]
MGKSTSCPGKESLQRCLLGLNAGPANWPDASRLVEAICSQLCRLYPSATRTRGVLKTRWSLVLGDYVAIREAVLGSPRLMAQNGLQLNQRTLSQWFSSRQKKWERAVLEQEVRLLPAAPAVSLQPVLEAKGLSLVQVGQGQPFDYGTPEEKLSLPLMRPAPPAQPLQLGSEDPAPSPPPPPPPLPPPGERVPRTTAFRRRKAAEAAAAAPEDPPATKVCRQTVQYTCTKCGQPKRLDTGLTRIFGVSYCAAVGRKTVQE